MRIDEENRTVTLERTEIKVLEAALDILLELRDNDTEMSLDDVTAIGVLRGFANHPVNNLIP